MLLSGAGCVFMGFILFISGVQGRANSICALKGSSADLLCSARHPTSTMMWYTVNLDDSKSILDKISAYGNRVTYHMSAESNFTLTIKDLTDSDENIYCCSENADDPGSCIENQIKLRVADLQVKVIPTTDGQTVTLICSSSCPLTENPAVYIWYKNREFLYQDWSPWYQQLVSSEEAVTYSCAIKGYEDLRAPQVSVDSVSWTCFNVTYAKGRMCSHQQTSEDEPCSITYPTEVHVQWSPAASSNHVRLTCNSNCPLTDRELTLQPDKSKILVPIIFSERFSCAVKGHKDLRSDEICLKYETCWSVNYVSRRICALEGSSVNISSEYSENRWPKSKLWYKIKRRGKEDVKEPMKAEDHRVTYHDNMKNQHILTINNLKKDDSAEYTFTLQKDDKRKKPGVTLVVTGLKVEFSPSAVVTEDQRVTLTCSTSSCPLTDNTNYIWFFNSQPLTPTQNHNKQLVLDPVSSQHAGNYSCAVKSLNSSSSSDEETLSVQSLRGNWRPAAAGGVCAALLVLITLSVFCWIRRKRTSSPSLRAETSGNMEQLNPSPAYENLPARRPVQQEELHYSRVHFSKTQSDPVYSTVQPHQPKELQHVAYAAINFRPNTTPK